MKYSLSLLLVIFLLSLHGNAQDSLAQKNVSKQNISKADSTLKASNTQVNAVEKKFNHKTDSLQKAYHAPLNLLHSKIARLNHKKDSLTRLKLPTSSVSKEIKQLEKEQTKKLREMNAKISEVKKKAVSELNSLHLPPQAQQEITALTKTINGFSVPKNFFNSPLNLNAPSSLGANLPNASIPGTNLPNVNSSIPGMQQVNKIEGQVSQDISVGQKVASGDEKSIEQTAQKIATQNSEVNSLVKEGTQATALEKQAQNMNSVKGLEQMAAKQTPAVNHFLGKEKELQSAMGEVSKLKQKYSNVSSLSQLPKRPPNPLKNKPWHERTVPGLNYFVQSRHYTLVDLNPYIGWRFDPHLTVSLGWNERIGISKGSLGTHRYDRVFGFRSTATYQWQHGIIFQASPEVMWAYVPVDGNVDTKTQKAIFGVYAGVRKGFPVFKSLSGYSEVLYHFSQVPSQNIYGDRVVFRFGFEYTLKKVNKATAANQLPKNLGKQLSLKDSFNIVSAKKKFGIVNLKGDTVVAAKFSKVKKLVVGQKLFFIVAQHHKYGALDKQGKTVIPVSYPTGAQARLEIVNREIKKAEGQVRRMKLPK
ncbi:MAG: hypothetical protein JSS93_03965 [Bacteroidetes bacterium]|nr:hypothetical protein [Bacteroidota bacterium]